MAHIWDGDTEIVQEIHEVIIPHLVSMPICKGDYHYLPKAVQGFIVKWSHVCKPRALYVCDGGEDEAFEIITKLKERGTLHELKAYENCFICRTDP